MVFFLAKRASFSQCYWDSVRCFCRRFVFFSKKSDKPLCAIHIGSFHNQIEEEKTFLEQKKIELRKKSNWKKLEKWIDRTIPIERVCDHLFHNSVYERIYCELFFIRVDI